MDQQIAEGVVKKLRLRWQGFWARRSRVRIALTGFLLTLTLLAIIWLVLPAEWQRQVQSGVGFVADWLHSLDTQTLLVALIGLCVVEGLALLFVPSYRKHGYLATAPQLIPPVSVYLDGENEHPERAIRPFMRYLKKRLNGARADLLYFQQAAVMAGSEAYRTLRRSGFWPIDVPHDPTGKGRMLEAVDREIAMHAFERALLGPAKQLFIIISRDGDFVPLIYRLVALGHRVEVWASEPAAALTAAQQYINVVPNGPGGPDDEMSPLKIIDLRDVIPEFRTPMPVMGSSVPSPIPSVSLPVRPTDSNRQANRPLVKPLPKGPARGHARKRRKIPIPRTISNMGEKQFYLAIMRTLQVHSETRQRVPTEEMRNSRFRSVLGVRLSQRLIALGYGDGIGTSLKYWLEHMSVAGVLAEAQDYSFPERGAVAPSAAARRMFDMVRAAADTAVGIAPASANGIIQMHEIADALALRQFGDNDLVLPLTRLIMPYNSKRATHARYFVHSARALGLLRFEDVPGKPDEIRYPRLPEEATNTANAADSAADTAVGEPGAAESDDLTQGSGDAPPAG